MAFVRKRDFLSFNVTPALMRSTRTLRTLALCSVRYLEKIAMSSKHARANCHMNADNMTSIVR